MRNEPFVKTTGQKEKLTGYQKAAILLGELGNYPGLEVIEALKLTPQESKKIRQAMRALGKYPRNINDILREEKVLKESLRFGEVKGIYTPAPKEDPQTQMLHKNQQDVSQMLQDNPEVITNLIRSWLDD